MGIAEELFRRTNSSITYHPPRYGKEPQLNTVDESYLLDPDGIHEVQTIVGILLFYGRAVDYTLLPPACNMVGSRLGQGPTEAVLNDARRMLYSAATWPDARVTFYKSDMRPIVHSDDSHLSETGARSRAGASSSAATTTTTGSTTSTAASSVSAPSCPQSPHPQPRPNTPAASSTPPQQR